MDAIYAAFAGLTTIATIAATALFGIPQEAPQSEPATKVITVTGCAGLLPENVKCP